MCKYIQRCNVRNVRKEQIYSYQITIVVCIYLVGLLAQKKAYVPEFSPLSLSCQTSVAMNGDFLFLPFLLEVIYVKTGLL